MPDICIQYQHLKFFQTYDCP